VAVACSSGHIHLVDVPTNRRRCLVTLGRPRVRDILFSPDDKKLLVSYHDDPQVQAWNMETLPLEKVDTTIVFKDDAPPNPNPNPNPNPRPNPAPGTNLQIAEPLTRIEKYTALAIDPEAKGALAAQADGTLHHYSYPEFKSQSTFKLAGKAYRAVLDAKKKLLYTISVDPVVGLAAGFPPGDLQVYDVADVLAGKADTKVRLKPAKTVPLNAVVPVLLLSPTGDALYYLHVKDEKTSKLVKLDTATLRPAGEAALAEGTDTVCQTGDGKSLYAGGHTSRRAPANPGPYQGTVQHIDVATLKVQKTVKVDLDPFDLAATNEGLVFASGGSGQKSEVRVLDLNQEKPVLVVWKGNPSGSCLKLSDDQKRLYICTWKAGAAAVTCYNLPDRPDGTTTPKGTTTPVPGALPSRGELTVGPDGDKLICDSGVIFALKDGGPVPKN
jgi:WD40 repeat protein